jgi:hypothetical protein
VEQKEESIFTSTRTLYLVISCYNSKYEEYIITRGMLFFFNCEKRGHLEIECHEGNETEKLIEKEDNYEAELISV